MKQRFFTFFRHPLGVLIASVVIISIPFYIATVQGVNHARQGCERLNANRYAEYKYLTGDLAQRKQIVKQDRQSLKILQSARPVQAIQRKYGIKLSQETLKQSLLQAKQRVVANQGFIDNDTQSIKALQESTLAYAIAPNSPIVNCDDAYPQPFPL